jgi:UDP-N-acetylglucosamine/UDP-N-acetylgalactosamine 4-epimerase
MSAYAATLEALRAKPRKWLVTGCAGFIGSHLMETLLAHGQSVVGMDNFTTGFPDNLDAALAAAGPGASERFRFVERSVADLTACRAACVGVDAILHEAGFISVPASLEQPLACHETNVTGTLNLFVAARDAGVKNFVYASSAAVYGDDQTMPQCEDRIGRPLSPYGASKLMDELYAWIFARDFGLNAIGLRYFNVFGPRQTPHGGYAAVIPLWISTLIDGGICTVNGDGSQTRDFCHVANVVQANLLAGTTTNPSAAGAVYNVALGGSTTLVDLHRMLREHVAEVIPGSVPAPPKHGPNRPGDIWHSSADTSKIRQQLAFEPEMSVDDGLRETVQWFAAPAAR